MDGWFDVWGRKIVAAGGNVVSTKYMKIFNFITFRNDNIARRFDIFGGKVILSVQYVGEWRWRHAARASEHRNLTLNHLQGHF